MTTSELARAFIDAIQLGDVEAARALLCPDAKIWHNFDDAEQTVDENLKLLGWMVRKASKRTYDITRLEEVEGGYLQQHTLTLVDLEGKIRVMHACVVAQVRDGKIARIEEYLDPSSMLNLP
ncbi:MAG: ketosteroid isomerase-like protein [Myxococcota bacterium]|jgi:ketosteroid isomerase-like protein